MSVDIARLRKAAERLDREERRGLVSQNTQERYEALARPDVVLLLIEYVEANEAYCDECELVAASALHPGSLARPLMRLERAKMALGLPHIREIAGEEQT